MVSDRQSVVNLGYVEFEIKGKINGIRAVNFAKLKSRPLLGSYTQVLVLSYTYFSTLPKQDKV